MTKILRTLNTTCLSLLVVCIFARYCESANPALSATDVVRLPKDDRGKDRYITELAISNDHSYLVAAVSVLSDRGTGKLGSLLVWRLSDLKLIASIALDARPARLIGPTFEFCSKDRELIYLDGSRICKCTLPDGSCTEAAAIEPKYSSFDTSAIWKRRQPEDYVIMTAQDADSRSVVNCIDFAIGRVDRSGIRFAEGLQDLQYAAYDPDNDTFILSWKNDGYFQIGTREKEKAIRVVVEKEEAPLTACYSAQIGKKLVMGFDSGEVTSFSVSTHKSLFRVSPSRYRVCQLAPLDDHRFIAVSRDEDSTLCVLDAETGTVESSYARPQKLASEGKLGVACIRVGKRDVRYAVATRETIAVGSLPIGDLKPRRR